MNFIRYDNRYKTISNVRFNIRNQAKNIVRQIAKEQQEQLPKHRRKEDQKSFLRRTAFTSGI